MTEGSQVISSDIDHSKALGGDVVTDVLIRNVSEADLRRIDAKAERLGLSRSEFLRRRIAQEAAHTRRATGDVDRLRALHPRRSGSSR
ncbi:MAG: ribbon-helix-helix protein, CopG family [Microbacterium sp.]